MLKRTWITVGAMLALLLLLAGCAPAETTPASTTTPVPATPSPTERAVCQPLATARQLLTSLAAVGDNTTVAEVQDLQQKLTTAITSIQERFPGTPGTALSDLQSANAQLAETLKGLPPDQTLGQAVPQLATIKEKAVSGLTAVTRLSTALNCSP
jgi:hypothetical protein